jgi:hypothetical protein
MNRLLQTYALELLAAEATTLREQITGLLAADRNVVVLSKKSQSAILPQLILNFRHFTKIRCRHECQTFNL